MAKSTRPTVSIHNTETDEIIVREYNDEEFAQYEANQIVQESLAVELLAIAAQRQAILDKLGLTADEAKLLIG